MLAPAPTPNAGVSSAEISGLSRPARVAIGLQGRAFVAGALAILGVFSLWPTALSLWSLWTTDPLKSIGGFVPLVSLVLILRVWRAQGWEAQGTWWGLVVLLVTVASVHLRDGAVLELVISPSWSIMLPPHSLVAFAYASGVVLLFGGGRLWRAALFPVALMWFVNPVPHAFNRLVDLPLQHVSAHMARALAQALGQRLTPDQLTLMFTPEFGMFIAPGCDGIRGAVTMGFLALIAGYLYRFRWRTWALTVGAAVLLGYAFNLLRLCVLVVYYVAALRWRGLQGHAEMADYCIGAMLFFCAAVLFFAMIRRLGTGGDLRVPALTFSSELRPAGTQRSTFWPRSAAFAGLIVFGAIPLLRGLWEPARVSALEAQSASVFPAEVGPYRLQRSWPEKLSTGQTIFEWAEYAKPGGGYAVSVGISPVLGAHDTLLCHAARGEDWVWHGPLSLPTQVGVVSFSGSLFNDGSTQFLEATTVCSGAAGCGQWTSERKRFGLIYSRPDVHGLLEPGAGRPVPVLLRAEVADAVLPADAARAQLTGEVRDFLAYAPFGTFTYRYRRP